MDPSQINRPKEVTIAVILLCLLMATGFIQLILNASMLLKIAPPAFIAFTVSAFLGIGILLTYMIWNGRNWVRITFLVLFIIGTPFSILQTLQILIVAPISGLLNIGGIVIQIIALILLFQKPSSDWFKEMKVNRG